MFVGTPCQVAALKNYLNQNYTNLFLADFICHDVPNQWLFDKCVTFIENENKAELLDYSFRVKSENNLNPHYCQYTLKKNNKTIIKKKSYHFDLYYTVFKKYIAFREGCYVCKYSSVERISDLTLGDFWGINKYDNTANLTKGVSMISLHTEKGNKYFKRIKTDNIIKEYSEQIAVDNNFSYDKATIRPAERNHIYQDFENLNYKQLKRKYGYKNKPIKRFVKIILQKIKIIKRNF